MSEPSLTLARTSEGTTTAAPWLIIARNLAGEAEIKGSVDNPRIVEMFKVAGHAEIKDDETAWCAAFVGACLRLSGYEPSWSLLASSYAKFGADLGQSPRYGCICYLRPGIAGIGGSGHVGFYVGEDGANIVMLGGNQSDRVKESHFPKTALGAYRWPVATTQIPESTLPNIRVLDPAGAPLHIRTGLGELVPVEEEVHRGGFAFDTTNGGEEAVGVGASGDAVRALQRALDNLGYHLGDVDGEYGPLTRGAVLAFQADNNLPTTGTVDTETRAALAIGKPRPLSDARKGATVEDLRALGSKTIELADWLKKLAIGTGGIGALGVSDANFQVVDRVLLGAKAMIGSAGTGVVPTATAAAPDLGPVLSVVKMLLSSQSGGTSALAMGAAALLWRTAQQIIAQRLKDHQTGANLGK